MTGITIKTAEEVGVTSFKSTYIMNDYAGTVKARHTVIPPIGVQFPILDSLNNKNVQFHLPTNDSAINITESGLQINIQIGFKFTTPGIARLINGRWIVQDYKFPDNNNQVTLPEKVEPVTALNQPHAVSTGAIAANLLLESSDITYNGLNTHTPNIDGQTSYHVKKISSGSGRCNKQTWFIGGENDAAIEIQGIPYDINDGIKRYKLAANMSEANPDVFKEIANDQENFVVVK